jgi:hypothetical protein
MTCIEARAICDALRGGKRFATRFQEEEWGLETDPDGRFRKWSRRLAPDCTEESNSETLREEELIEFLMTWYGYERIKAGLR